MAPNRLRDLITLIRSQKTIQDERNVIQKELADIRTSFKEDDSLYRTRNVAKSIYIHMLGYPTHFAQLECLKLIASTSFGDKRIGYLGAMLLLDENVELNLLLVNSIKVDLANQNHFVACLALNALSAICSEDMGRDLTGEIETLLTNGNALIRKKATLCACRLIRKCPDLVDYFLPYVQNLANEKGHGILLTGVALVLEMCRTKPEIIKDIVPFIPNFVKIFKVLLLSWRSPEYDVGNISDPFLQVLILRLFAVVGERFPSISDSVNDILAQVATNTEANRVIGSAVLYECSHTICRINTETSLRVLAINILGRFIINTDRNIRYVALGSLLKYCSCDVRAVQRHLPTILECLRDSDTSIMRRALELVFALINTRNIIKMMSGIMMFLENCAAEFKDYACTQITKCTARYSPNPKWRLDTLFEMLRIAGQYVNDGEISHIIFTIANSSDLEAYATIRLYYALLSDISIQSLVKIASWCLGEYGHLIVSKNIGELVYIPSQYGPLTDVEKQEWALNENIRLLKSETFITNLLESVLTLNITSESSKEYVVMALMKLCTKMKSDKARKNASFLISNYQKSINFELQQRAIEFNTISQLCSEGEMQQLFDNMPAKDMEDLIYSTSDEIEEKMAESDLNYSISQLKFVPSSGESSSFTKLKESSEQISVNSNRKNIKKKDDDVPRPVNLLSILGLEDDTKDNPTTVKKTVSPSQKPKIGHQSIKTTVSPSSVQTTEYDSTQQTGIFYQKNKVLITFNGNRQLIEGKSIVTINLEMTNGTNTLLSNVSLQVAVVKNLKLKINPPSADYLEPQGKSVIKQNLIIESENLSAITKIRARLSFLVNEKTFVDQFEPTGLP